MKHRLFSVHSTESHTCEGVDEWLSAQDSAPREREPEMKEAAVACPESLDLVRLRSLQVARDKFHRRVKPWSFTILLAIIVVIGLYNIGICSKANLLKLYFEGGNQTSEEIVEGESDLDYTKEKRYFKFSRDITERVNTDIIWRIQTKEYSQRDDLDSRIESIRNAWRVTAYKSTKAQLDMDIKGSLRDVNFKNRDIYTYNNNRFDWKGTVKLVERWKIISKIGFSEYNYKIDRKDREEIFVGLDGERYLWSRMATISAGGELGWIDNRGTPDMEYQSLRTGLILKLKYKLLDRFSSSYKRGRKYIQDDEEIEEIEDDYYKYDFWKGKTGHRINRRLNTTMSLSQHRKSYSTVDYDHRRNEFMNSWRFKLGKGAWWQPNIRFGLIYRDTKYEILKLWSYLMSGACIETTVYPRQGLKLTAEIGARDYDYRSGSTRDRMDYFIQINGETDIPLYDASIGVEYRHRKKDYGQSSDLSLNSIRVYGSYRF